MKLPAYQTSKLIIIAVAILAGVGVIAFVLLGTNLVPSLFHKAPTTDSNAQEADAAAILVRNDKKEPVYPFTLQLTPQAAKAMDITSATIVEAATPTKLRALPPQMGTLAYDSDRLFQVKSRFAGEVSDLPDAPSGQRLGADLSTPRPYTVGDRVKAGDLLAVVWSQTLGDKKGNLIDALIDLKRDQALLKDLKKLYYDSGAIPKATLDEAERAVKKDRSTANSAERTLRNWRLTDEEIDALYKEAETIGMDEKRDPKKETNWSRVEIRAYKDGVIVEKNTHLGDWVDPANYGTPMYRIADLSKVQVWIKPAEEYLPVLQDFLNKPGAPALKWDIVLQAEPKAPPLTGTLVRIGPAIDPNEHAPLLVGLVDNPNGRLLVGQFITATIYVPVEKGLVEIPTSALNEQKGQSVVFVQPDPEKLEFRIKAVNVVYRFKDVVYVRDKLTEEQQAAAKKLANILQAKYAGKTLTKEEEEAAPSGILPVEALTPGEHVVTESVVELSSALRDLLSKGK